jgi:hypothetical protein
MGSKVNSVGGMLDEVLGQDWVTIEVTLGHEIGTYRASCVEKCPGINLGSVLQNKGACHNTIGVDCAIQEVQAGDVLESVLEFMFTTNTVGDYEIVVVIC